MPVFALADFGSTFTKVCLVDSESGRLLGAAQHPTTVDTDVMDGFSRARAAALEQAAIEAVDHTVAASSAAGGLRMVAVGLVDHLTAAAAHQCALGAGAKVTGVHSGRLTSDDARKISASLPDLILFAGGTDGGDRDRVLANARVLAAGIKRGTVIVACNREVAERVRRLFDESGHETVVVANVMPSIQRQNPEPARSAIRELFISRVVHAKGLSSAPDFFEAVVMPTPAAVLMCAELIAAGTSATPARGAALVLDVGGATTDVHSVITPGPGESGGRSRPRPMPAVRTVEGDLGVRWSADSVAGQDEPWLVKHLALPPEALRDAIRDRQAQPSMVRTGTVDRSIDRALAASCITIALGRHVGTIATRYFLGEGAEVLVEGRDLREVSTVVATGGSLAYDSHGAQTTVATALGRLSGSQPGPQAPEIVIDHSYVLAAVGLLATVDPEAAGRLLLDQVLGTPNPDV